MLSRILFSVLLLLANQTPLYTSQAKPSPVKPVIFKDFIHNPDKSFNWADDVEGTMFDPNSDDYIARKAPTMRQRLFGSSLRQVILKPTKEEEEEEEKRTAIATEFAHMILQGVTYKQRGQSPVTTPREDKK